MCHHTMCATTVERMGMEMADTGNNDDEQQWIVTMLERLSHSQFRAKFALTDKDRAYARTKGKATIDRHAREMLRDRIGAAEPKNDGRQTPMRGHPVFIAQHACACCCRGCLHKWYHVPVGRELTENEQERIVKLLMAWIARQLDCDTR